MKFIIRVKLRSYYCIMSVNFDDDVEPTRPPALHRSISTCGHLCSQGRCPNPNHALTVSDDQIATALNHPKPLFRAAAVTLQVIKENKHYVESPAGHFKPVDKTEIGRIAYLLDIFLAMGVRERNLRCALQNSENVEQILKMFETFDLYGLEILCTRIIATEDCSVPLSDFMRQAQSIVNVLKGKYCTAP